MTVERYLAGFEREYTLLADQAGAMSLDTPILTCPGWTARDLVRHTAGVHRWVRRIVVERQVKLEDVPDLEVLFGRWPDDSELVAFYRVEARECLEAIRDAPLDLKTGQFIRNQPSRLFWGRRQFQEATMHRVDLQIAAGVPVLIAAEDASDGVDEMLCGFVSRKWIDLHTEQTRTIGFEALDTGATWVLTLSREAPLAVAGPIGDVDCLVRGTSQDIHLSLWNRPGRVGLSIEGDQSILDLFGEKIKIRW